RHTAITGKVEDSDIDGSLSVFREPSLDLLAFPNTHVRLTHASHGIAGLASADCELQFDFGMRIADRQNAKPFRPGLDLAYNSVDCAGVADGDWCRKRCGVGAECLYSPPRLPQLHVASR